MPERMGHPVIVAVGANNRFPSGNDNQPGNCKGNATGGTAGILRGIVRLQIGSENTDQAPERRGGGSPGRFFAWVLGMVGLVAVPAGLTLHTVQVSAVVDSGVVDSSPYGYTVSLLLFLFPAAALLLWLFPREGIHLHKRAFLW